MPLVHRAAWVLPIVAPPIRDGWVAVDAGRVVAVGGPDSRPAWGQTPVTDSEQWGQTPERRVILPGLVNAHTHLELAWMKGQVASGDCMPAWAERLIDLRLTSPADGEEAIAAAIDEARATGTSLVGDITNGLGAYSQLAASPLSAAVFYELIGFNHAYAVPLMEAATQQVSELQRIDKLRPTIVPHAPYSVSPTCCERSDARAGSGR